MTMIEKVAKALYDKEESRSNVLGPPWEGLMELPIQLHYRGLARTAIEAMREPSEAMRDASYAGEAPGEPNSFDTMWEQAIDAALKEP